MDNEVIPVVPNQNRFFAEGPTGEELMAVDSLEMLVVFSPELAQG